MTLEALKTYPDDYIKQILYSMARNGCFEGIFFIWLCNDEQFIKHITGEVLDMAMKVEHQLRQYFACNRNHSKISDPYTLLIDVYNVNHIYDKFIDESDAPLNCFRIGHYGKRMIKLERLFFENFNIRNHLKDHYNKYSVVESLSQFQINFDQFSSKLLKGMNWNNIFCAGGACMACILPNFCHELEGMSYKNKARVSLDASQTWRNNQDTSISQVFSKFITSSDIDLFLYDLTPEQANLKVKEIMDIIQENAPMNVLAVRSGHGRFIKTFEVFLLY